MKFFLSLVLALALTIPGHAQKTVAPEDAPIADVAPDDTLAPTPAKPTSVRPSAPKPSAPKPSAPQVHPTQGKTSPPKNAAAQAPKAQTPPVRPTQAPVSATATAPQVQPTQSPAPLAKTPPVPPTATVKPTQQTQPTMAPEDAPLADDAPGETAAPASAPKPMNSMPMGQTPVGQMPMSPAPMQTPQAHAPASNAPGATNSAASAADSDTANVTGPAPSDDADIAVPPWWNVPASFAPGFMRGALGAGLVVALLCGYLSVFVVLKRIAFVGVALSQMCSAGVALGFLLGFSPIVGALLLMIVGVALFAFSPDPRRVPRESYIGAVYAVAGACGVLLVAVNASGESHMLDLLQGDILAGDAGGLRWLIGVYAVLALAHLAFQKEWVLVSFDREAANTLGFPAARWDFFLFLTIGIAIALANRTVGALLTSALLILPGATALLLCSRLRAALWLAPLLTVIPVVLGLHTSFVSTENAPPSALITAILFALFIGALVWRTAHTRLQRT